MGFYRQEYWNGWPGPPSGDLPDSGIKPASLRSPALAWFFTIGTIWEAPQGSLRHWNWRKKKIPVTWNWKPYFLIPANKRIWQSSGHFHCESMCVSHVHPGTHSPSRRSPEGVWSGGATRVLSGCTIPGKEMNEIYPVSLEDCQIKGVCF